MNVLHKVALQGLLKNRARTLVTVIGVMLSAALFTGVATLGVSLLHYMVSGAAARNGDWHVAFYGVDEAFVRRQAQDGDVRRVASYAELGYAALPQSRNPDKPYLFVAGFDGDAFDMLPIELLSGRLPQSESEVIIPFHLAANGGVKYAVGDTLTLSLGRRTDGDTVLGQHDAYRYGDETLTPEEARAYTVVGVYQRHKLEERSAPGYTLITCSTAQGGRRSAYVSLLNPRGVRAYAARAAQAHPFVFNDEVLRFMGLSDDVLVNTLFYALGGVLIALIMIGSVFLIYNSFSISLSDRMHQFGILLSVGATQRQLTRSVLFEGLCIGAAGIPLGMGLGLPCIGLVLSLVQESFGNVLYDGVPLTMTLSAPALAAVAVISLITILISAYMPAHKAAATPVMACIRQTGEIRVEPGEVRTPPFVRRTFGMEGTLALKNFRRNRRRYRSIVLSLTLSVVLFVGTQSFSAVLLQAAERAKVVTSYDILVSAPGMPDAQIEALFDKLRPAQSVTGGGYQADALCECDVPVDALSDAYWSWAGEKPEGGTARVQVRLQILDDASFLQILKELKRPAEAYMSAGGSVLAVGKMQVSDREARTVDDLADMFAGDTLRLGTLAQEEAELTFETFVPPDSMLNVADLKAEESYFFQVLVPWSLKAHYAGALQGALAVGQGLGFLSGAPSQSASRIEAALAGERVGVDYTVYNLSRMMEDNRNILFIVNLFSAVFVAMISLIAAANVFNTISTNIRLRRRELAMLRSVGMGERAFSRMMRFECLFYGLRTLAWSLPLSVMASYAIYRAIDAGEGSLVYRLPVGSLAVSLTGVFIVIFSTMMYATSRIKRENIIDALRDEMT